MWVRVVRKNNSYRGKRSENFYNLKRTVHGKAVACSLILKVPINRRKKCGFRALCIQQRNATTVITTREKSKWNVYVRRSRIRSV